MRYEKTVILLGLLLFLTAGTAAPVFAHAMSAAFSTISVADDGMEQRFSIDELSVLESVRADADRSGSLDAGELERVKTEIAEWMSRHVVIRVGGLAQRGELQSLTLEPKSEKTFVTAVFRYRTNAKDKTVAVDDTMYEHDRNTGYVDLLTVRAGDEVREAALKGDNRHWEGRFSLAENADRASSGKADGHDASSGQWASVRSFLLLGMEHILTGYDHLLFLLALLLRRQTLKQYLSVITAFTVAHSITLTLAVLEIVRLPSQWVETAIALSIVYVAVENVWRKEMAYRWMVTFAFGLIHGLGFAGLLSEMAIPRSHLALSLASFNIGIELVQAALVLLIMPLLLAWQRSRYHPGGLRYGSAMILLLAAYWTFERIAG